MRDRVIDVLDSIIKSKPTLRRKFSGLVILAVIIPAVAIAAGVIRLSKQQLNQSIQQTHQEIAQRIGDRITIWLGNVKGLICTLARRQEFVQGNTGSQVKALKDLMRDYVWLEECVVMDRRGKETLKLIRDQRGRCIRSAKLVSRKNRREFTVPISGTNYVSPVDFSRGPRVIISVPIKNKCGVLMARINLKPIFYLVSETKIGQSGYAYVVDEKGNLIAHPRRERLFSTANLAHLAVVREAIGKEPEITSSHLYRDEEKKKVIALYRQIKGLGWAVIVQSPVREAYGPIRKLTLRVVGWTIFWMVVVVSLGMFFVHRMLKPVEKLQTGVEAIGRGDLDTSLDVRTDDEIGELAHSFNKMAQSLKASEGLKKDMLHMLVHDMKNPLTGIMGGLKLVLGKKGQALSAAQWNILEMVGRSSKRLLGMVSNLLDVVRVEEGKLSLRDEKFKIEEIVRENIDEIKPFIRKEKKKLVADLEKGLPAMRADRDLLDRVISNLLNNALKHTPTGGEIRVQVQYIPQSEEFRVAVANTGEWIPENRREEIFEKFRHGEEQREGWKPATGLGLTFCKAAVEAHGGKIWVESQPGKGNEFIFVIPQRANEKESSNCG